MPSTHRVFFAIDLSPAIKTKLLSYQHRFSGFYSSPIDAHNLHITVSFLGKLSNRKIENIIEHLPSFNLLPFQIEIGEPSLLAKNNLLALMISRGQTQLTQLKSTLETQLKRIEPLNIEKRPYLPHISLFRDADSILENMPSIQVNFEVTSVALFESHSTPSGIRYEVINDWPLKPNMSIKQKLLGPEGN